MGVIVMDTSTDTLGVAVGQADGALQSAVVQRILRGHSRLLQPSVQFAMESASLAMSDLEAVAVGIGPGSYTGVRMAVATGKAMAHALSIPLITIPTLDALAITAAQGVDTRIASTSVLTLLFARRSRAYGAWFTVENGQLTYRSDARVRSLQEWLSFDERPREGNRTVILQDFPHAEQELFEGIEGKWVEQIDVIRWADVSTGLPFALLTLATTGNYPTFVGEALHAVEPEYALPVEAEKNLLAKKGGGKHDDRL